MNFLLDTHVVIWWMVAAQRLSPRVDGLIRDISSQLFVSVASLYEIEYKR
jgi:PIN domain nuclease of toxin-antitoxin system